MIVLLGSSGYVGGWVGKELERRGIAYTTASRQLVGDPKTFSAWLKKCGAEALINCAGFTGKPNVDACETQKAACLEGNAVLPGVVREACENAEIPWGHVSSGCIFTGRRKDGLGFRETDPPNFSFRQNNCSFYSGCKALGEEVLESASQCYIWRLRIPFENQCTSRNYLTKLIRYERLLDAENSLSQLEEFAAACVDCIEKQLPFGTYNLTNPGAVNTRQVIRMIEESGVSTKKFVFFDSEEDFMQKAAVAPRSNCVLDSSKALAAGLKLSPIEDALRDALARWVP